MNKIKPTRAMLDFRKESARKQKQFNEEQQNFNVKLMVETQPIKDKIQKLKRDRELAAEAVIGYGLALKSLEENIKNMESELADAQLEQQRNKPPYRNTYDDFKIEFGINESEVDWSLSEFKEAKDVKKDR